MSKDSKQENRLLVNTVVSEPKDKHFIENDLFEKLLALREEVYQKTEINVSPRKLVNMLLKQSDFELLHDQLIQKYS